MTSEVVQDHPLEGRFYTVLLAQLATLPVVVAVGWFSCDLHVAISSGYGVLVMLVVNTLLARRIRRWNQQGECVRGSAVITAASRFAGVIALLVAGSFAGLWLPAVAGGIFAAQLAVYIAGFRLLIGSETRKETKGETA